MKRITQLVVVAGLAFGAQSVGAGDGHVPFENDIRDQAQTSGAAVGASGSQSAMQTVAPVRQVEGLLEALGIAGHGPFPSSGGPIDGGE